MGPYISGRYTHYFDDSDFRRNYCFTVVQNDCGSVTISNWNIPYKDGTIHMYTDSTKYPPRVWPMTEVSYLTTSSFKIASADECD